MKEEIDFNLFIGYEGSPELLEDCLVSKVVVGNPIMTCSNPYLFEEYEGIVFIEVIPQIQPN